MSKGGDLLERVNGIRKQTAIALGFIVPPMRIRDNITLRPGEYNVKIRGNTVASGEVIPTRLMAMDPGVATGAIEWRRGEIVVRNRSELKRLAEYEKRENQPRPFI